MVMICLRLLVVVNGQFVNDDVKENTRQMKSADDIQADHFVHPNRRKGNRPPTEKRTHT